MKRYISHLKHKEVDVKHGKVNWNHRISHKKYEEVNVKHGVSHGASHLVDMKR
jgi:hypothetical protein